MPLLFAALFGFIVKVFTSDLAIRIAAFVALAAIAALFTTQMVGYAQGLVTPALHPMVLEGLSILPLNTSSYISIMVSAVIAKWLFIAGAKSLAALR